MTRHQVRTGHPTSDAGASLVLVLAMVTAISLGLLALASLTTANLRATTAVRAQVASAYSVDASIDSAITAVRADVNAGRDTAAPTNGDPCPDTVVPASTYSSPAPITVTCQAMPASGQPTTSTVTEPNVPTKAILVTSTTETGLTVSGNPPAVDGMTIGGSVHSNSPLPANPSAPGENGSIHLTTQARMTVSAGSTISATGACVGANYSPSCDAGTAPTIISATDSAWQPLPKPSREVRAADLSAAIMCSGTRILLSPGVYRSGAALSRLTDTTRTDHGAACTGKVLHLAPGAYYFDLADADPAERVWTLNDRDVALVGGTLASDPRVLGSGCNINAPGAQLVFGGVSRMQVLAGTAEVCPPVSTVDQRVAVYGLRNDIPDTSGTTTMQAQVARDVVGRGAFLLRDNARALEAAPLSATYAVPNSIGAVELATFAGTPTTAALPDDAVIDGVDVVARYQGQAAAVDDLVLDITPGGGATVTERQPNGNRNNCPATTRLCANGGLNTTVFSFPGTTFPSKAALEGAVLRFSAAMSRNAATPFLLDGVELRVRWTLKGVQAQNGCVTATGAAGCRFLYLDGNNSNMSLRGTVYTWGGRVVLNVPNQISAFFKRGVVARKLDITLPSSFLQTEPVISLPTNALPGPPLVRRVVFTALVGGVPHSRARVTFVDDYLTSTNLTATVDDYSVLR